MNKKPLYLCRPLLNAEEFIAWACTQGFKTTLAPDDMHVTLAFSKEPVDWEKVDQRQPETVEVRRGDRSVETLGPDGAVVVRFESRELANRWAELITKYGCSWDYPDLKLHVSITYAPGTIDLDKVEPYTGLLLFGVERLDEVEPTKHKYKEKATKMTKGNFTQLPDSVQKGLFIPITKVDVEKRTVYGTLSEETPDKMGEVLDYETAKPAFIEWSETQKKASNGKSLGNLRAMHGSIAAGKFTDLSFDDDNKRVEGAAKVIDNDEWQKVLEGVYTGFSIGGGYAKRWADPRDPSGVMRYTPTLAEVSLVDNPCHGSATFSVIKADGSVELRKFLGKNDRSKNDLHKNAKDARDEHNRAAQDHKDQAHHHRAEAEKYAELRQVDKAAAHDVAEKAHLQAAEAAISGVDYEDAKKAAETASKKAGKTAKKLFNPTSEEHHMTKNTSGVQTPAAQAENYLALIKAAEGATNAGTATPEQQELLRKHRDLFVQDGKAVKPKTAVVQFNKWQASDGSFHDTKREAEGHELTLEISKSATGLSVLADALLKAKAAGTKRDAEDEEHEDDSEETKKMKAERHEKKLHDKEEAEKAKKAKKTEIGEEGQQAKNPDVHNNEDAHDPKEQGLDYPKSEAEKRKAHKAIGGGYMEQARNPDVRSNEGAAPGYHQEYTNKEMREEDDQEHGDHDEEHGENGMKGKDGKMKGEKNKKSSETGFSDERASEKKDPDFDAAGEANGEASKNPANSYINKKAAEKKSDKPYGNVEYADPGHQEDGKKRYPIDTEEHIRAAWNYVNKEKNAGMYSAEDLKSVKNKIVAAWKKKIDKDGPPSAEKGNKAFYANKTSVLAKGLDFVAHLAHKIQHLHDMYEAFEMEQVREGDDTDLCERFEAWIEEGGNLLVAIVGEEVAELINDEDDDYALLMPETVMCMSAGLPAGAHNVLAKAVDALQPFTENELRKSYAQGVMTKIGSLSAALVKAGARHSKADMKTIGDIHAETSNLHEMLGKTLDDHLDKIHKMCKSLGFEPAQEVAEEGTERHDKSARKMSKVLDQLQLTLTHNEAQAQVITTMSDTMTKAASTVTELTKTISTLNSRIEHLERQPMPGRGNVRVVSKATDSGGSSGNASSDEAAAILAKLTPEQQNMAMMKAALAQPKSSGDIMRSR